MTPIVRFQLRIVEPDGSAHLLVRQGQADSLGRECLSDFDTLTTSTIWYSTDGSFLQVEIDATPGGFWPGSWTLRRNDGSSVRYDAAQEKTYLRDRNGNEITVVSELFDPGLPYQEMEDAFGRKIRIEYPLPGGGPVQTLVKQVGQDGDTQNPLTWTITWGSFPAITAPTNYECFQNELHTAWTFCDFANIFGPPAFASSLQLPNGLQYQFAYNARYRELSRLTLPTEATVDYAYHFDAAQFATDPVRYYRILANPVNGKTVTSDGGTTETWNFANSDDTNPDAENRFWRTSTAPDGGITRYDFFGISYYFSSPLGGVISKITRPDNSILQREWAASYPHPIPPPITGGDINP
ncbi:MAG: hypothetical protein ACRD88_01465, partial [Terriglobia bacterium]